MSVLSYSGYISSKEEKTGDEPDAAEIFTITKDVPIVDQRVKEKWPCHGRNLSCSLFMSFFELFMSYTFI